MIAVVPRGSGQADWAHRLADLIDADWLDAVRYVLAYDGCAFLPTHPPDGTEYVRPVGQFLQRFEVVDAR